MAIKNWLFLPQCSVCTCVVGQSQSFSPAQQPEREPLLREGVTESLALKEKEYPALRERMLETI